MNRFRWWRDSRTRRRLVLSVYAVLLLAVAGAVLASVASVMSSRSGSFSDRLAETGDWLAGGTLALAAVAGLVALQAYASATGTPELQLSLVIWGPASIPADDVLVATSQAYPVNVDGPFTFQISIKNVSDYSARNPAIVIRLPGNAVGTLAKAIAEGWTVLGGDQSRTSALQWDGGPVYSIHGHSIRQLRFEVGYVLLRSPGRTISFELLAEGYRREVPAKLDRVNVVADWL